MTAVTVRAGSVTVTLPVALSCGVPAPGSAPSGATTNTAPLDGTVRTTEAPGASADPQPGTTPPPGTAIRRTGSVPQGSTTSGGTPTAPGGTALACAGGEDDEGAPRLTLAAGTPLDVSVPTDVGQTPWVIVFSYVDAQGRSQGDRTAVFPAGQRFSYHLTPPAGAQLSRLEVQSLIAAPNPEGGVEFPAVRTWVLVIDPAGGG